MNVSLRRSFPRLFSIFTTQYPRFDLNRSRASAVQGNRIDFDRLGSSTNLEQRTPKSLVRDSEFLSRIPACIPTSLVAWLLILFALAPLPAQARELRVEPKLFFNNGYMDPGPDYFHNTPEEAFAYSQSKYQGCFSTGVCIYFENFRPAPPDSSFGFTLNGVSYQHISDKRICQGGACTTYVGGGIIIQTLMYCPSSPISFSLMQTNWPDTQNRQYACVAYLKDEAPPDPPKDSPNSCPDSKAQKAPSDAIGHPIHVATGEKFLTETDYASPDGELRFERTYRSTTGYFASVLSSTWLDKSVAGDIGQGCYPWSNTYASHTNQVCSPYWGSGTQVYQLITADGRIIDFSGPPTAMVAKANVNDRAIQRLNAAGEIEWVVTREDNSTEIYNAHGALTSKTLLGGQTLTYTYSDGTAGANGGYVLDASGNPTATVLPAGLMIRITDAHGRALNFGYDAQSHLVKMTDPGNGVYLYAYDSNNNLSSVTYPDGRTRQYLYNEQQYTSSRNFPRALTGVIDENGVRFATYNYNTYGQAMSTELAQGVDKYSITYNGTYSSVVTDPLNSQRTYSLSSILGVSRVRALSQPAGSGCAAAASNVTYDTNGNVKTRTDFNGVVTGFGYDLSRNLETSRTEAQGTANARTITTSWDPNYRLPTQINEPGRQTSIAYDPATGNVLSKTIADTATGQTRTWDYTYTGPSDNTVANLLKTIDGPRTDVADVTSFEYYPNGDLHFIRNALGHTTEITQYDPNGRVRAMVDPNGTVTTLDYWPRGWLKSQTRGGRITSYEYDSVGNVKKVTLPDGTFVSYDYDAAHRLTDIWDAQGNRVHYTLDNIGNRTKEDVYDNTGALVTTKSRVVDALDRLWKDIGALNQTTVYEYDANGNLKKTDGPRTDVTDVTQNSYDFLNRLATTTDGLSGVTRYGYDAQDHLTQVQAPNNATTQYQYDGLGNLRSETSPDRGTIAYTYDPAGNVQTMTDARGITVTYGYDALNRLTSVTYPDPAENVSYVYDSGSGCSFGIGRLCSVQDAAGTEQYAYDAFGNVVTDTRTELNVTYTTSYGYDAVNRVTSITYPNGRQVSYARDALGNIQSVSMSLQGANTTLVSASSYRPDGLLLTRTFGNGLTDTRSYDLQGQLVNDFVGSLDTRVYGYDANGNLTSLQSLPQVGAYQYDALNRLSREDLTTQATASTTWSYDANGNRLTQNAGAYSYTAASNRLTQGPDGSLALDASGNTLSDQGGMRNYSYTQAGTLSQVMISGGLAGSYSYDAQNRRTRKSTPTGMTVYHYDLQGNLLAETDDGGHLLRDYVWADGTPIAKVEAGETLVYLHTDQLNTPRIATNPQGQIVWRWDGTAFGSSAPNEDPGSTGTATVVNLRFPGQYHDGESGLYYNWNRYYDPKTGRYVTSDPIGVKGGLNTYVYVDANPLDGIDPTGLVRIHGNWCGPNWTGGRQDEYRPAPPSYYLPPIDSLDASCKEHDICYWRCRDRNPCDKEARAKCMEDCDRDLSSKARRIGYKYSPLWGWMEYNTLQSVLDRNNSTSCGCTK